MTASIDPVADDVDEIGVRAAELRAGFVEAGFALSELDHPEDRRRVREWAELGATTDRVASLVERLRVPGRRRIYRPVAYLHDKVVAELAVALRGPAVVEAPEEPPPAPDPLDGLHVLDRAALQELLDAWRIARLLERVEPDVAGRLLARAADERVGFETVALAACDALGIGTFPHLARVVAPFTRTTHTAGTPARPSTPRT